MRRSWFLGIAISLLTLIAAVAVTAPSGAAPPAWAAAGRSTKKPTPTPTPTPTPSETPTPTPTETLTPTPTETAAQSGRASTLQPFLSAGFVNTAVGTGITTDPTSELNSRLELHSTYINSGNWSVAYFVAADTDPQYTFTDNNGATFTLRIPDNAAPTGGTDGHVSVTQPDKATNIEMWGATKTGTGPYVWDARFATQGSLLSDGRYWGARASGVSHLNGLIRVEEVENLNIPHSLAFGIANDQLKSGYVWPARAQDGDAATAYTGTIPMGSMFVLPQSVDIDSLGLTPEGRALAWTLQNYGAHVLIRSGTVSLYAEKRVEAQQSAKLNAMRTAWQQLRPMLEIVTNNTAANIAGGEPRVLPPLPEVVAQ